jgi:hypothetical protein
MDAAFMLLQRHGWDIHALSTGTGRVSPSHTSVPRAQQHPEPRSLVRLHTLAVSAPEIPPRTRVFAMIAKEFQSAATENPS